MRRAAGRLVVVTERFGAEAAAVRVGAAGVASVLGLQLRAEVRPVERLRSHALRRLYKGSTENVTHK